MTGSPRSKKTQDWRHNDRPGVARAAGRTLRQGERVVTNVSTSTVPAEGRIVRQIPAGTAGHVERVALGGVAVVVLVTVARDGLPDAIVTGRGDLFRPRRPHSFIQSPLPGAARMLCACGKREPHALHHEERA